MTAEEYDSPVPLQRKLEAGKEYETYFLDIDMPGMNGLEFARMILDHQPKAVLVFVSGKEEYVFQSFQVHPFSFVRKGNFDEDLEWTVRSLSSQYHDNEKKECQIFDEFGHSFELSLEDTLYLEAKDKYVNIVTKSGGFFIRNTLAEMENMLRPYGFVRIHKSFLANLCMIYAIKYNRVILDGGQELPLSRNKTAEVKRKFCQEG